MLPNHKAPADKTPRSAPSLISLADAVAASYHGVRAAMPPGLRPYGQNPIVIVTAADRPQLPLVRFLRLLPATGTTWLLCRATLPYQTTPQVGCTRLAAVRLLAGLAIRHVPALSDHPTSAVSTTTEVECVRQNNFVRLRLPRSQHTAGVPTAVYPP